MSGTGEPGDSEGSGPTGVFLVGGTVAEVVCGNPAQVVRDHLGMLLQVKNLVILLGSGASFHLGSPRTRGLTNDEVLALISKSGATPSGLDGELLSAINPRDNGDLEHLLNGLQLASALAAQAGLDSIMLGEGTEAKSYSRDQVESLRRQINRALAEACRIPVDRARLEPPFDADPLLAHRDFFARVIRSRRSNLPRPQVFTTNYDLIIERALDELGYPYIDGFSGTVDRRLNLAFYGLDFHRIETTTQSVVARAEGSLYLHKVHGSLNWRASTERDRVTGLESLEVRQGQEAVDDEELVLIYPTAAKEADSLAYPYSDLLRLLGDAVQQEDTGVLIVGYGFADPHINRLILRGLATNSAVSVFVADPVAVLSDVDLEALLAQPEMRGKKLAEAGYVLKGTAIAALAASADSRIAVVTGALGKFSELAALLPGSPSQSEVASPGAVAVLIEALEHAAQGVNSSASEGGLL